VAVLAGLLLLLMKMESVAVTDVARILLRVASVANIDGLNFPR